MTVETFATVPPAPPPGRVVASPRARRLAEELGVDLATVAGSGPGGRLVEEDVRRAAEAGPAPATPAAPVGEWVPLTGMRKAVAAAMVRSQQQVPHFYLISRVDMGAAAELLAELKPAYAAQGVKLTYTALVLKAVAGALAAVPELNAHCNGEAVRRLPQINVGLAVAAREGIVVPVIPQTDRRSLLEVARAVQDLAERARGGSLPAEAVAERSFTVSSLGGYPIDHFAALVNPPEVGILAVGRVSDQVVPWQGGIHLRPQLAVTLSGDHRAVDGATGARFLQELVRLLQAPRELV